MKWKIKTAIGKCVHLYKPGEDRVLCGRPQENYDTEEGLYTAYQAVSHYRSNMCEKCLNKAKQFEPLGELPTPIN